MFPIRDLVMPGNWRKSTYSAQDGNCVEAGSAGGQVSVRDTQDRDGPVLKFSAARWAAFTASLRG